MKDIEYSKMAHLYDKFYSNKNYDKEVMFIEKFVDNPSLKILDAGCGSGTHVKILNDKGYDVRGFDKSKDMIEIANRKLDKHFIVDDLLELQHKEKYDVIISFFAVFNHLKNYKQFETALNNLRNILKANGKIILDMHNPQKNGCKKETVDNATRIMKWRKCNLFKKEFTKIKYIVDGRVYKTKHTFKIFNLGKLQKIANRLGFYKVEFYENYNIENPARENSKNIQMVMWRDK